MAVTKDWELEFAGLTVGADTAFGVTSVKGLLDMPKVRTSDLTLLRRHGSFAGDDFLDARTITIEFSIFADGEYEMQERIGEFLDAFKVGDEQALMFQLPGVAGGVPARVWCRTRRRSVDMNLEYMYGVAKATVQLVAADPRIYVEQQSSVNVGLASAGGGELWAADSSGASGNYISTPDAAVLDITGDIDIRVDAALDDWSSGSDQMLVAKWSNGSFSSSYRLFVDWLGVVHFQWTTDGATSSAEEVTWSSGLADGDRARLRATLDVDNGAGAAVARLYSSEDGSSWTLRATYTHGSTSSIYSSSFPLCVGARNGVSRAAGVFYSAQVYDGIDGTLVANFDPADASDIADTSWTSSATGEVWTLNGAVSLVNVAVPTGATFPFTFPLTFGAPLVGGEVLVNNAGSFDAPVVFRIDGPVTDPVITNGTTGQVLSFTGSIAAGSYYVVDTAARSVLLNGTASRYNTLDASSDWFDLAPGLNSISFDAASYEADALLIATWRSASV